MATPLTVCPFDHHSPEHAADPVAAYRSVREGPGLAISDRHGGFVALARYADIVAVATDPERFSSALELPGDDHFGGGVTLPHNPAAGRMSLAEMDPPEWWTARRILAPYFNPEAIDRFTPRIEAIVSACIDRVVDADACDLVLDICSPVPAIVTLELVGMPTDEWERWAVPIHTSVYTPRVPGHPEWDKLVPSFSWIFDQIRAEIADRRRSPREDDLISSLMYDDEQPMDDDVIFETVYTFIAAGVDTTTSLLSAALWHLSQHPDERQRLSADESLLEPAVEEFLRFYSPGQAMARTVTGDVTVAGHDFQRGDRVLLAWASGNRDAAQFERPDEFVLDRRPNRHIAFGWGIHRCIGARLARREAVVTLREILRRMPDHEVDLERTPKYPDVGLMYGFQTMPTTRRRS